MGLFDKLFGKKKEDDIANLFKQISKNQSSISTSPNYQCVFFVAFFFGTVCLHLA